jgi:hypothetical protein
MLAPMIYTFKVHASADEGDLLETTHCAHGSDVLGQARALIEKHPQCIGVEVLMLGSRLFFMPSGTPVTGAPEASALPCGVADQVRA